MKEKCTCGFLLEDPRGWLLCHVTHAGNRWDVPKGNAELGEDHLDAARRELDEETGLILVDDQASQVLDLGQHAYQDHRDLHHFHLRLSSIDTRSMTCRSMVEHPKGNFPEVDAFAVFQKTTALNKMSPRLRSWILSYLPNELQI